MSAPGLLDGVALVDHHCHGVVTTPLDRPSFELLATEADGPAPPGCTGFDTQVGFAIRRWCAPVLGLQPHASPEEYLARRAELGPAEVNRLLLAGSGIGTFLVDTGYSPAGLLPPDAMADAAGGTAREIVRLEAVAEQLPVPGSARTGSPARTPTRCALPPRTRPDSSRSSRTGTGSTSPPSRPRTARYAPRRAGGWPVPKALRRPASTTPYCCAT